MATTPEATRAQAQPGSALGALIKEVGPAALIGLVGGFLLLWLFGWLAEEVFTQEFTNLDSGIALGVHSWASPTLDTVFGFFSTLGGVAGTAVVTVLAFAVLAWRHQYHHAWRLVLALGGGVLLSQALKLVFHRNRPALWPHPGVTEPGFSFPSGHAAVSLCLFGMLLWLGLRGFQHPLARAAWAALMVALILLIGLSRIYLGVHFPTDVLAGYLAGSFWLVMLLTGHDILARWRRARGAGQADSPGG